MKTVLVLVLCGLLAAAANAQECSATRQTHAASLANVSPKGCLKELVNATAGEALQDLITPECFNKLNLNLTNNTGAAGCPARSFTVAFDDQKKCAEGFDTIAEGTMNATKTPGTFNAGGEFTTGTPFKGVLNAKNQMTVTVQGSKCELTYSLKPVGKAVALTGDAAAADEKPAAADAKAPAASKAPAAADAPKKSSAAASSASVLLAVLCAVLAVLL